MRQASKSIRDQHLSIMVALSRCADAAAFFCITRQGRSCLDTRGTQRAGDATSDLAAADADALFRCLTANWKPNASPACRLSPYDAAILANHLGAPFDVEPDGRDLLLLALRKDNEVLGVVGAVTRAEGPRFGINEVVRVESIEPLLSDLVALHQDCEELQRLDVVTRAIPGFSGTYFVVDSVDKRIVWIHPSGTDTSCEEDLLTSEDRIVTIVDHLLPTKDDEPIPSYRAFPFGTIVKVAGLGQPPIFGGHPCVAVALVPPAEGAANTLSPRERQIARLLLGGYTTVNAAAILNVSENTIRTYVRRLYRKLEVTNRADLARTCRSIYGVRQDADSQHTPVFPTAANAS